MMNNTLITHYETLKTQAEKLNLSIASLRGAREEVVRQLQDMGVKEEALSITIDILTQEIAAQQAKIKKESDILEATIAKTKAELAALNDY